jgi:hypothetical protein
MKDKEKIPYEETDLSDPRTTIRKLSEEIIQEVNNLTIEELRRIVLYSIAKLEELYHVEDEKRALRFMLKNSAEAFGQNNT